MTYPPDHDLGFSPEEDYSSELRREADLQLEMGLITEAERARFDDAADIFDGTASGYGILRPRNDLRMHPLRYRAELVRERVGRRVDAWARPRLLRVRDRVDVWLCSRLGLSYWPDVSEWEVGAGGAGVFHQLECYEGPRWGWRLRDAWIGASNWVLWRLPGYAPLHHDDDDIPF